VCVRACVHLYPMAACLSGGLGLYPTVTEILSWFVYICRHNIHSYMYVYIIYRLHDESFTEYVTNSMFVIPKKCEKGDTVFLLCCLINANVLWLMSRFLGMGRSRPERELRRESFQNCTLC
jgi:hypothetical protein